MVEGGTFTKMKSHLVCMRGENICKEASWHCGWYTLTYPKLIFDACKVRVCARWLPGKKQKWSSVDMTTQEQEYLPALCRTCTN